jgi:hypothetical protein
VQRLSHLAPEMADALCRVATDGGLGERLLYTNAEEHVAYVQKPVLLNGVPSLLARGDLADRALAVTLHRLPELRLERLPRMADLTTLDCAAAPGPTCSPRWRRTGPGPGRRRVRHPGFGMLAPGRMPRRSRSGSAPRSTGRCPSLRPRRGWRISAAVVRRCRAAAPRPQPSTPSFARRSRNGGRGAADRRNAGVTRYRIATPARCATSVQRATSARTWPAKACGETGAAAAPPTSSTRR